MRSQRGLETAAAPSRVNPVDRNHLGERGEDDPRGRAAECDARGALSPELAAVVDTWPDLSDAERGGVMAMIGRLRAAQE